jgi:hypothetical protein
VRERFTSQDTTSAFAQIRRDRVELRPRCQVRCADGG